MNGEDRNKAAWLKAAEMGRHLFALRETDLTEDEINMVSHLIAKAALEAAGLNELVDCSQSDKDVVAERQRQVSEEGWTPEHDDAHSAGEMAVAAACYAFAASAEDLDYEPSVWPWDSAWWKPRSPRENLVRAGALILAEIDRIDRAALTGGPTHEQ